MGYGCKCMCFYLGEVCQSWVLFQSDLVNACYIIDDRPNIRYLLEIYGGVYIAQQYFVQ